MNLTYFLYFISLSLFLLPQFELLGLSTYGVSKIIIIVLLIKLLVEKCYKKPHFKLDKTLLILLLLFFLGQSLSIINTIDNNYFLNRFKDLTSEFLFLIVSLDLLSKDKTKFLNLTLITLLIGGTVNLILQFLIYITPSFFIYITRNLFNYGSLSIIEMNINRNRIYLPSYDEVMIPFIFYLLITKKNISRTFIGLYLIPIAIISFLSNFRTRLLMIFFALIFSFAFFIKQIKKNVFIVLLIIMAIFFTLGSYSYTQSKQTIIDRFLLENQQDIQTIISRTQQYSEAIRIGLSFPIFGVGLGNYNYYTSQDKREISINKANKEIQKDAYLPHNIFFVTFAETGFFGLTTLVLLIIYFIYKDLIIIKSNLALKKAYVLSFWTLFLYSLFNPTVNLSYNILFWVLRVCVF